MYNNHADDVYSLNVCLCRWRNFDLPSSSASLPKFVPRPPPFPASRSFPTSPNLHPFRRLNHQDGRLHSSLQCVHLPSPPWLVWIEEGRGGHAELFVALVVAGVSLVQPRLGSLDTRGERGTLAPTPREYTSQHTWSRRRGLSDEEGEGRPERTEEDGIGGGYARAGSVRREGNVVDVTRSSTIRQHHPYPVAKPFARQSSSPSLKSIASSHTYALPSHPLPLPFPPHMIFRPSPALLSNQ
jgi:hypothetical protein